MHCVLGAASIFFMDGFSCFCCCVFLLFQLQSELLGASGHAVDETNMFIYNNSYYMPMKITLFNCDNFSHGDDIVNVK